MCFFEIISRFLLIAADDFQTLAALAVPVSVVDEDLSSLIDVNLYTSLDESDKYVSSLRVHARVCLGLWFFSCMCFLFSVLLYTGFFVCRIFNVFVESCGVRILACALY